MTRITTLFLAGLTTLFLGTAAPSASAQGGFLHLGDNGISVGVRTGDFAIGVNTGRRHQRHERVRCGGHWRTYSRRVWREGYYDRRWVPGHYESRYDGCGRRYEIYVRGYHTNVFVPGHWDHVSERRRSFCAGGYCR